MDDTSDRAVAIVAVSGILPDATTAPAFWENVKGGRYSIIDVPLDRWDPATYYDADPKAPDKTYSKIGGFVRAYHWDPVKWKLPIPPRVALGMDGGQQWGVAATREALVDYGWPERKFDFDRTAVILGNAMAGEKHYQTATRADLQNVARQLDGTAPMGALPQATRAAIAREIVTTVASQYPEINEDAMPGELSNCLAGRIANLFDFHGPNYVCDAACASAMAALSAAVEGLIQHHFNAVIAGGIDRNMGASTYVKFCKIGALSGTGSRPYADGADGFVMGEGAALFILKRLEDAERDGDKIYAVIRGVGGASDGKGKGITAPNPVGQRLAIKRGWEVAGLDPATASLIEGHGTSTRVGDLTEIESLMAVFGSSLAPHSIPLGSVKSNIGHLKGAAGAAGILKTALALRDKVLPPSLNFTRPNPNLDWSKSPFFVNTELRDWPTPPCGVRRAGVSAFGFGGTNFHVVMEEYIPGRLKPASRGASVAVGASAVSSQSASTEPLRKPLRGALVLGAATEAELLARVRQVAAEASDGKAPAVAPPKVADLRAAERLTIDYADAAELAVRAGKAVKALESGNPGAFRALRAQGIFRGRGAAGKVAFLYTGQGSQYVNMLKGLCEVEPLAAEVFADADRVMTPLLGKPLSDYIFVPAKDKEAVAKAEEDLKQTAITQPAVLATDVSLTRVLNAYGIHPDMVMGHSLGEYGALVAAGVLPFGEALEAVSARGREMTRVSVADNGQMAAVFAGPGAVEEILKGVEGYVVVANYNSRGQSVIGGESSAVEAALGAFSKAGIHTIPLPVSHAFHTRIVAPASGPMRATLERFHIQPPRIPAIANVTGDFYPSGPDSRAAVLDLLSQQVAAPVQFVKGLETLRKAGATVFVEVGPKRALVGFVEDVFADDPEVVAVATNHPKSPDVVAVNHALCALYAAGLGAGLPEAPPATVALPVLAPTASAPRAAAPSVPTAPAPAPLSTVRASSPRPPARASAGGNRYEDLGRMFADFLDRGMEVYRGGTAPASFDAGEPVVITGAGLGLPGLPRVFDDLNVGRLLRGQQLIDAVPMQFRNAMASKRVFRLVKHDAGESRFEAIDNPADVIKLAGRAGAFDLETEFGVSAERIPALDSVTRLAMAAGLEALRDAGIPLVLRYKTTTRGTQLPDGWALPESLRDDTGVIFACAFPSIDSFGEILTRYHEDHARRTQVSELRSLRDRLVAAGAPAAALAELDGRVGALEREIEKAPFELDRRFLFRVLTMGHSQFAEHIGARGPNTQINGACASTTQAMSVAEDWIRAGRCRRVIVISADNPTSDTLLEWLGAGFLASGAAATDERVEDAALPFDRRRHGMIVGMGAAALVVESAESARSRGLEPICELLSAVTANSAFHGTRLDVSHISQVMEALVAQAEQRSGARREEMAGETVFVSHETYTPARGGSASAEVFALRGVFGPNADRIVVANTKGYTGHAMGAGVEDVGAVKMLETGLVPAVANFKEVDPELGPLNLSKGGAYPIRYAIRLAAGFGSQIAMTLTRWVPTTDGRRRAPEELGFAYRVSDPTAFRAWLSGLSGYDAPELEIAQRTLRVKDQGAVQRPVTPSVPTSQPTCLPVGSNAGAVVAPRPLASPAVPAQAVSVYSATPAPRAAAPAVVHAAAPAPSVAVAPTPAVDPVLQRILAIVTEKTGYPAEMLDPDLDLEADLGVDTVKQAELFTTVREEWGIPRDDTRKLREYPTLRHVVGFVYSNRPDLAAAKAAAAASPSAGAATAMAVPAAATAVAAAPAPVAGDAVMVRILAIVTEKTGYPAEMLDPDLDLEADLGVDTVKQAELFTTVREEWGIPRDDSRKLRDYPTLRHVVGFVYDNRPDLAAQRAHAAAAVPVSAPAAPISTPVVGASAVPVVAAAMSPATDAVMTRILAIVTDKTGYPSEMLDPDLDLEADLGVDTVKQAELFTTVREEWGIPRDDSRKLRDYPTLRHVVGFVYDNRPDLAAQRAHAAAAPVAVPVLAAPIATSAVGVSAVPVVAAGMSPATDAVMTRILAIVTDKTGYPSEMLDPDLDLEADLGVDTVKQAELFTTVREEWGIPRDDNRKLRDYPTLRHVVGFVYDNRPDLAAQRMSAVAAAAAPVAAPLPVAVAVPLPSAVKAATTLGSGLSSAPPAVSTAPAAGTPPPVSAAGDAVAARVLALVAEKTGYPTDMLDLDLDLEADLGVDTVKQAELFTTVREEWGIARDDNRKLRDYPTLRHVIGFVYDNRPDLRSVPAATTVAGHAAPAAAVAPTVAAPAGLGDLAAADRVARRTVISTLRPALALCKPTGVTLDKKSRVVVFLDRGGVGKALLRRLEKLDVKTLVIEEPPTTEALQAQLEKWMAKGPIQGVYWLPALDAEGDVYAQGLDEWREALRIRVKLLYTTLRALYEQIGAPGTFLVSATRLGGQHGYDAAGAVAPLGGPVVGFTKTIKREKPESLVKAVDFEASRKTAEFADLLLDETLADPGVVEVGYKDGLRYAPTLAERPAVDGKPGMVLGKDSVFVVTGAAGSITSAITADLAAASGGVFHLLDLVPEPDVKNPDLARFRADKDALKRDIFERLKAKGERATPAMVEKEIAGLERQVAALSAIEAVRTAGGTVHYYSCDLRDGVAVGKAMARVREVSGKVDVLLHAGGLEISRFLKDKEPREFDLVFDVKADGWFNLLKGLGDAPLGSAVVFSSIAGRFGNGGQTDYSSANDLLCKAVSAFRTTRPSTRGIAIDWTAWGDIGMATRGSIPKMMELAGIDMLPAASGIPTIRRELTVGGTTGEIVVAGRLGLMLQEFDETGGLNAAAVAVKGPMVGRVLGYGLHRGLEVEVTLDPKEQPFLFDHQIDGTPVLPGVMGIESFAEAAALLVPGWHVGAVEAIDFLAPFKFYRNEPRVVRLTGSIRPEGSDLVAECRLVGSRLLPGQKEPQLTTHFAGRVRLVAEAPKGEKLKLDSTRPASAVVAADIYKVYFHGPAYQVLEAAWRKGDTAIGLMAHGLPPNHVPAESPLSVAPRLVEFCFQAAGVHEMGTTGKMGLPNHVARVRSLKAPEAAAGKRLYAVVSPVSGGTYDVRVVDEAGQVYVVLEGYRTVELGPVDEASLAPFRSAMQ